MADGNVIFYFGDATTWESSFYLNNTGVEDFKQGAIDEFIHHYTTLPSFPTDFQRLYIANVSEIDLWGMAGFKLEIKCSGQSAWWGIYSNRGVFQILGDQPNREVGYLTSVGAAGTDSYNGDHEVFWLMNIGDHDGDGVPDDLANCNEDTPANDVECRVQAALTASSGADLVTPWRLTENWWDVGNDTYINPLEMQYGETWGTGPDDQTDNIWRWFWTSKSFTHSAVASARLKLDSCTHSVLEGPCTMQANYLHATVMQAWGKQSWTPFPYFRSHVYEGDFTNTSGWLSVTTGSDSVTTNNVRYYQIQGTYSHVEASQDSEHSSQQMSPACGYKSVDMILSTRGFPYENIATEPQFDEPAFDDAVTWEEATAVAHLVWGYKTMCCGSWDCCGDAADCSSNIPPYYDKCDSTNYTQWWTWDRCVWAPDDPSGAKLCVGGTPSDGREKYFWRDGTDLNTTIEEVERFPHLIDYNGEIHWECKNGIDDDGDGALDFADDPDEFWTTSGGDFVCIMGAHP